MKKIKKAIMGITALVMAFSMTAICACSDDGASSSGGDNTTQQGGQQGNQQGDQQGGQETSYEVTAEEWKAALSPEAFKNVTVESEYRPDQTTVKIESSLTGDKAVIYYAETYEGETDEDYYSKEPDGKYYRYSKYSADTVFTKSERSVTSLTELIEDAFPEYLLWYTGAFTNCMTDFEYDGTKKAYFAAEYVGDEGNLSLYNVSLGFANGKLVSMEAQTVKDDESSLVTATFTKYGATAPRDLPTNIKTEGTVVQTGGQVTADEWKAALGKSAFVNFTANLDYTDDNIDYVVKGDLNNNGYYYNDNQGRDTYYEKTADGKYYRYVKGASDAKFIRTETTQTEYEEQLWYMEAMAVTMFGDSFADFTYNAADNSYTADSVVISGNTYGAIFKFENGKLIYADIDLQGSHLITAYVYGSTTVNMPTDYIEGTDTGEKQ